MGYSSSLGLSSVRLKTLPGSWVEMINIKNYTNYTALRIIQIQQGMRVGCQYRWGQPWACNSLVLRWPHSLGDEAAGVFAVPSQSKHGWSYRRQVEGAGGFGGWWALKDGGEGGGQVEKGTMRTNMQTSHWAHIALAIQTGLLSQKGHAPSFKLGNGPICPPLPHISLLSPPSIISTVEGLTN